MTRRSRNEGRHVLKGLDRRPGQAAVLPVEAAWFHINTPEDFQLAEEGLLRVSTPS